MSFVVKHVADSVKQYIASAKCMRVHNLFHISVKAAPKSNLMVDILRYTFLLNYYYHALLHDVRRIPTHIND